jgi:hypothetical protein|tara:strand:+ start:1819 stop:2148 length:330 start_codon:yes stop_codon:yes gene_type:complete
VTYTWNITKLGLSDELNQDDVLLENAIVNLKWKRVLVDSDGNKASYVGNTKLYPQTTSAADFVAVNNVTAVQAIEWLEAEIGTAKTAVIDAELDKRLAKQDRREITPNW